MNASASAGEQALARSKPKSDTPPRACASRAAQKTNKGNKKNISHPHKVKTPFKKPPSSSAGFFGSRIRHLHELIHARRPIICANSLSDVHFDSAISGIGGVGGVFFGRNPCVIVETQRERTQSSSRQGGGNLLHLLQQGTCVIIETQGGRASSSSPSQQAAARLRKRRGQVGDGAGLAIERRAG